MEHEQQTFRTSSPSRLGGEEASRFYDAADPLKSVEGRRQEWNAQVGGRSMILDSLTKVEQCGFWPELACTTMIFFRLEFISSERPIPLLPHDDSGAAKDKALDAHGRNELPKKVH